MLPLPCKSLGIRAGDRMIIVSENCIALAALLLAASRARCVGDRRQSAAVARANWIRSAITAAPAGCSLTVGCFDGSCGPCARAMAPRSRGSGPLEGDRRQSRSTKRTQAEPVEEDPARTGRRADLHVGYDRHAEGRDADPRESAVQRKDHGAFPSDDSQSDKVYVVLPISHIVGISLLMMTLMVGGTVRLVSKYDPAALAKAIAEEGITDPQRRAGDLSATAGIQGGGGP